VRSLRNSPIPVDVDADLRALSEAAIREALLIEITTLEICYFADEISGEVFIMQKALFSADIVLGQRIRFQVAANHQIVNIELVP